MEDFRRTFLQLSVAAGALRFGHFTLKSGRVSPYFFNAGAFCTGAQLHRLAHCYAAAIDAADLAYDMIFGPAYKGIPLAAATACALASGYGVDVPFAYNRKETKRHGEGGQVVGAPLRGRVLIIDDVISAGTATRQAVDLIAAAGATSVALAIGLDRQERGKGSISAVQEIARTHSIQVISVITLADLQDYLEGHPSLNAHADRIAEYRAKFGA